MATISRNFSTVGADITNTAVVTTEVLSTDIDMETVGYEGAHLDLSYTASNTLTDLVVSVYGSLDGTNFDTLPLTTFNAANNLLTTAARVSFIIKDCLHFRVGLRSNSTVTTTTSFTSFNVALTHQAWDWQSV